MGTKMGPSYANLFVGYVEHQFFNQYDGPKPDFYGRYIDDCIGPISSSREELNRSITSVNSFHPALKYTWEISETSQFLRLRRVCSDESDFLTNLKKCASFSKNVAILLL